MNKKEKPKKQKPYMTNTTYSAYKDIGGTLVLVVSGYKSEAAAIDGAWTAEGIGLYTIVKDVQVVRR